MNTPSGYSAAGGSKDSPEQIERRIDATRDALSQTLDALESRLSPRRRLDAAVGSARERGEELLTATLRAVSPSITTMIRMDHTHVLALFRRFKPHTSAGRKRALVTNACLALEIHAQLEEEIFYPALLDVLPEDSTLAKSVPEHDNIRKWIETVRGLNPGSLEFDVAFRTLIREVLHHVADEETMLLPLAEELLTDRLGALGAQMTARRMQLLGPHLQEVASTSVRSFPVFFGVVAASVLLLGFLAIQPRRSAN
jgi:DUF438 domain-containing protein